MMPLIIESNDRELIARYLSDKYFLGNLVCEVSPENDSIGIAAIRHLIDRAKFSSPEKSQQVFLIRSGHLITPIGQNALLKTLEESQPSVQFLITTHNHYLLLPTIVSRCRIIRLSDRVESIDRDRLRQFVSMLSSSAKSLLGTDQLISGKNPDEFLLRLVSDLKQICQQKPTPKRLKLLSLALTCHSDLTANVNPKLAIDHFLLRSRVILT